MRLVVLAVVLLSGLTATAQDQLYREPYSPEHPAVVVEPPLGLPLTLSKATLSIAAPLGRVTLRAFVQPRTVRDVSVSGITLRAAIGPLRDGMMTFRLRPATTRPEAGVFRGQPHTADPPVRLMPDQLAPLFFDVVPEDPLPPAVSIRRDTRVVVTLERLEDAGGQLIFENPHASELLWEALGKPSLSLGQ